jgi:hypothetical protein
VSLFDYQNFATGVGFVLAGGISDYTVAAGNVTAYFFIRFAVFGELEFGAVVDVAEEAGFHNRKVFIVN